MKKLSVFICVYLWTIFLFFPVSAQEFKTVQDGIEHAEMTRGTKEEPVHINLLKLDLTKVRLDVTHAMDAAIGLEKTSSIASRYGAVAAINGGFFRIDKSIFAGDATGALMIDNRIFSESYNHRIALFIHNKPNQTQVKFDNLTFFNSTWIGKKQFDVQGINRQRSADELILFTPDFHRTTLTDSDGLEIIVRNGKITALIEGKGSNEIPTDGFVLSASGKARAEIRQAAKIGVKVKYAAIITDLYYGQSGKSFFLYGNTEDIVGGVPQLVKNGKIDITWQQEKSSKEFVETRHPRTAVAKLKDRKFLMVTVDGRQAGYSVGMNLNELAAFLLELGATDAMNLDGGGSTTMFLGGKVVNKPSDKEGERSVSDVILVFPRKRN